MEKTALVTGGNSGIGFATAEKLKEKGYRVYISGRDPEKVQRAAAALGVDSLVANMEREGDIRALARPFEVRGLDVLVNNAGIFHWTPIGEYEETIFDRIFYTNVRAPLFLIQSLLSALEKRRGGITNISSIITQRGVAGFSLYAATKGAVEAAIKSLALELAPRHIRINGVCPGAIETPIFAKLGWSSEQLRESQAQIMATIPLKRLGMAAEVAEVILAQLEATYVTGSIWEVDGGVNT